MTNSNTIPTAPTPLDTATPVEVDTFLAAIAEAAQKPAFYRTSALAAIRRLRENADKRHRDLMPFEQDRIAESQAVVDAADERIKALRAAAAPAEQRFAAERWTRAFLVNNSNGHVHNSMNCSTCFPTTEYVWLPELSGSDEADIVAQAGERACTVCYPTAPVEVLSRPTQLFTPDEKAAQQRRTERAAKKAAADAAKVLDPRTGDVLFKTERAASNAALAALKDIAWYDLDHPYAQEWLDQANLVAYATAARNGTDPAAEFETFQTKAVKASTRDHADHVDVIKNLTYTAPEGA